MVDVWRKSGGKTRIGWSFARSRLEKNRDVRRKFKLEPRTRFFFLILEATIPRDRPQCFSRKIPQEEGVDTAFLGASKKILSLFLVSDGGARKKMVYRNGNFVAPVLHIRALFFNWSLNLLQVKLRWNAHELLSSKRWGFDFLYRCVGEAQLNTVFHVQERETIAASK